MEELVIDILKNNNKSFTLIELNDLCHLHNIEEYKELEKVLDNLISKGIVHKTKKNKYIHIDNCSSLLTGTIHINKHGNGFVDTKNAEDTFVHKKNLNGAVEGDLVEIDLVKNEGIVVRILKRDLSTIVGEMVKRHGRLVFEIENKKKNIYVELTKSSMEHLVEGHKVLVKIKKELSQNLYLGEVIKVLGHKNDPGVDILTIASEHNISLDFSEAVKEQVSKMPTSVSAEELEARVDLRKEKIFTIDGDDTKDIDDAVSIQKEHDLYRLKVHIADVSYYVKEGTPLFESAFEKGTSSYLADTVLPMLPHELSNGICSLNENVDRLTLTCEMLINSKGKVVEHDIYPSVICSNKKMTYKCVNKVICENIVPEGYENFVEELNLMKELAQILRNAKTSRGYIDFGLDEAKIVQDETGRAIDVVKRVRKDGENLIEDFMIVANETVAEHIANMDLPFVYRVHDKPRTEKIEDFMNLVKMMGYKINVNTNNITPITMQNILKSLEGKNSYEILSDMLLRSMKKAVYSPNNIGHFGIASKYYTHFTSPIRRFPDLIVHTLLRKYLFNHTLDNETLDYYRKMLITYCEQASEREVAAIEAEREVFDMKAAEYMLYHIGEIHEGIVSGVTNFGLFIELPNLIEGLVHISTLKGFYNYVPELLSLVSENNIKYTIGDKVKIKVVGASKEAKTIDFEIVGEENGDKK